MYAAAAGLGLKLVSSSLVTVLKCAAWHKGGSAAVSTAVVSRTVSGEKSRSSWPLT